MFKNLLLDGTIIAAILLILARLIPNDKLKSYGVKLGTGLSLYGRSKAGAKVWEKLEEFMENSLSVFLEGVKEGLDSDDGGKDEPVETVQKAEN